jgi:hypothetical protein
VVMFSSKCQFGVRLSYIAGESTRIPPGLHQDSTGTPSVLH